MPSTQTGTESAAANVVTARMIAALSRFVLRLVTKLRSILMISNGSDRICASEEKPVPKSSSASRTPWFLRLVTIVRARSMSANSELSVISTTSRSAGKAVSARIRTIRWANQPSASCDGEMLTEILIVGSQSAAARKRLGDDLLGKTADQSDFFGDRDEDVGADDSGQRMLPARQHFEADDLARREVDLRFEIRKELVVLEAEADALLDLAVGDQCAFHSGVKPDRPRHAAAAGTVHGDVGAAKDVGNARVSRGR